jgi:hypothetical protein
MLVSRLNPTKFPWSNPDQWLVIPDSANADRMDPVFLGRLAALAKAYKKKITLTSAGGARDTATQIRLYKTLPRGKAAKPGTSWHEYGLAADCADEWVKGLNNGRTDTQKELLKFGLFKPMAAGNKPTVVEDWHIQPLPTGGILPAYRSRMAPMAIPLDVVTFQTLHSLVPDGVYGPKTARKAQEAYWGDVCL